MIRFGLGLIVLVLAFHSTGLPATAEDWKTYTNDRFGFSIDIPMDLLHQEPAPSNDDGRTFTSGDGGIELLAYGAFNIFDQTPKSYLAELANDQDVIGAVKYQRQGKDWVVASGLKDSKIVYQKTIFSCHGEVLNIMVLTYAQSEKSRLDPIVSRMSKSLKPGKGYDTPVGC
jgi:hypothetical protein